MLKTLTFLTHRCVKDVKDFNIFEHIVVANIILTLTFALINMLMCFLLTYLTAEAQSELLAILLH
jgi:hypothetical protein